MENNFKKYPLLYRLLHDKKNNTKFFNDLCYQEINKIRKIDKKNEKVLKDVETFDDKIFFLTKNKNLSFEENLYMQKIDYLAFAKMNAKISLFFSALTFALIKLTKKSLEVKKPFAFLDNNRLLHNRLCSMRNSLHYSLRFFLIIFSGISILNIMSIYILKYVYPNDIELEKRLKEKYIDKLIFYEQMIL